MINGLTMRSPGDPPPNEPIAAEFIPSPLADDRPSMLAVRSVARALNGPGFIAHVWISSVRDPVAILFQLHDGCIVPEIPRSWPTPERWAERVADSIAASRPSQLGGGCQVPFGDWTAVEAAISDKHAADKRAADAIRAAQSTEPAYSAASAVTDHISSARTLAEKLDRSENVIRALRSPLRNAAEYSSAIADATAAVSALEPARIGLEAELRNAKVKGFKELDRTARSRFGQGSRCR